MTIFRNFRTLVLLLENLVISVKLSLNSRGNRTGTVWSRASPHSKLATAHAGVTIAGHATTVRSDSAL